MRRICKMFCCFFIFCVLWGSSNAAFSEEKYDPLVTLVTLNMAISSINNIVTTSDRIILDQEYRNIINNLSVGSIADDDEVLVLFERMMDIITNETLRLEEEQLFRSKYTKKEQNALVRSLSGVRAYGGDPWSFFGSLLASSVSTYFGYKDQMNSIREELDDSLWSLKKERVMDLNDLQKQLLTSSWRLLRKYKLSDDYRITESNLRNFSKALDEQDKNKALIMFAHLEQAFSVYPPFWYYYGKTARELGKRELALRCFDSFEKVWRGVLRKDPFFVEVAKEYIILSNPSVNSKEIAKYIEIIRNNSQVTDWMNHLFAGVFLFAIGEKEEAMKCIELNIAFDSEQEISRIVLDSMKSGGIDLSALPDKIRSALPQEQSGSISPTPSVEKKESSVAEGVMENEDSPRRIGFEKIDVGAVSVYSLACSPDGALFAIGKTGGDISIFDLNTRKEVLSFPAHPGWTTFIPSLSFSSDGQKLLSGGDDDVARLHDVKTGNMLAFFPHNKNVVFVGFSSDESTVFTGSGEIVRAWDVRNGGQVRSFELEKGFLSLGITCGEVSSKGDFIVVGHGNHNFFMVLDDGFNIIDKISTKWGPYSIAVSQNMETIATGDLSDNVTLYSPQKEARVLKGHKGDVKCVAISPDGSRILSGSTDDSVKLWDAHSGELLASFLFDADVHAVTFSKDGTYAIAGGNSKYIYIWDIEGI